MLKIESNDEFRSHVMHKEEMRESNIGHNSVAFCYMISAEGTFDDAWSRECRGITFDATSGRVNGRPLHKFFNLGERAESRIENLDWSKVVRVMDKRDGSMITTVITPDGIQLKSKKTFTSDVALAARDVWDELPFRKDMEHWIEAANVTMIFEYTAPDARIVLAYPTAELKLLHIRSNDTGVYFAPHEIKNVAEFYRLQVVDEVHEFTFENPQALLDAAQTREGIEGWIVQFENGDMVKVKTKWYLERHRAMTFLRERDIAEAVLNESLDDLKSLLVSEGVNIDEILAIEARVVAAVNSIKVAVEHDHGLNMHLSRKDFAIKFTGTPFFGLLMSKYIEREPDYKGYFEKEFLKDQFTLRQLVLVPSVAEGD